MPPDDVTALADRLGLLLGDRTRAAALGAAGHAVAAHRFGMGGFAERFEKVYASLVR